MSAVARVLAYALSFVGDEPVLPVGVLLPPPLPPPLPAFLYWARKASTCTRVLIVSWLVSPFLFFSWRVVEAATCAQAPFPMCWYLGAAELLGDHC